MKTVFLLVSAIFCLFVTAFPGVPVDSVNSDMKNVQNLIDGDFGTISAGLPGTNIIVLQFGTLKYLKEIKIYFKDEAKLKYFVLNTSENFIEWRTIIEKKDVQAGTLDLNFDSTLASFVKIAVVADKPFAIQEIEAFDAPSPGNKVTDVRITAVTENAATVRWQTKVKSQGTVIFNKKVNGVRQSLLEADYRNEHTVSLKGLLKGTDYMVKIVCQAPDGTKVQSAGLTFRTKGIPLPEIWELKGENITPFSAKIRFLANVPVHYEVQLGKNEKSLQKIITEKNLKDQDTFEMLGLQPETTYYYKLVLSDRSGNVTMTPAIPFLTPAYNVALGKKAIGTFNNIDPEIKKMGYGETTVDKTVDGNLNYFGGMAISYNADNSDQYVVIDLEKAEPIKRLDIYWWGLSYSRDYRIDLSNDGKFWQTVAEHIDADKGKPFQSPAGDFLVFQSVPLDKTARLVRLFVPAGAKRGTKVTKWEPRPSLYLNEIAVIKDVKAN